MLKGLFGKKTQAKSNSVIKVRLMGMNERALNLFTMFLNGPARGLCEIVDDGSHQIVIIDLDAMENSRLWLDMRRQFAGPAIVLSVREQNLANGFWVAKPVNPEQFSAALGEAKKALHQSSTTPVAQLSESPPKAQPAPPAAQVSPVSKPAGAAMQPAAEVAAKVTASAAVGMNANLGERSQNCCGDIPDEVYLGPAWRAALFYDPAQSFVGKFREAMRRTAEGGVVNFTGLSAYPLYVSAADNFVSTPMPEAFLRPLCVRTANSTPIDLVFVDKTLAQIGPSEDKRLRRLDNMLWKLALWSSRGRVELGTSLDAPVRLRAWPNLPRLMTVPHGLRIAALWVMQPTGLLDTARKLDVPHRYVFAFYCACNAFDLVEQLGATGGQAGLSHGAKSMTQEKRGLFGSLLKKLGF